MRHLAVALIVSCLALAGAGPARAQSVDGIAALMDRLERAISRSDGAAFAALFAPTVPRADVAGASADILSTDVVRAVVRERDRAVLPASEGRQDVRVVVDVFVERARSATVSTFRFDVTRVPDAAGSEGDEDGAWRLRSQHRLSRLEGLYRLALDTSRQFSLKDFSVTAEDVRLTFASGAAFVAEIPGGVTALVLLGDGMLHFAPAPAAERGQVRIFCGRETLDTPVSTAFVRLNPDQADTQLTLDRLVARAVNPPDLRRAEAVFRAEVVKSFNLDLYDMSRDAWSLVPASGDMVMELRTRRYRTLTYARSSGEAEDVSLFDRERRRNISVYPSAAKVASRGPYYSEDEQLDYDVAEYDVTAAYEPEREWLEGRARLRLRVRAYSLTSLSLRLHEALTVRSIVSEEQGRLLALRVKGQNSILVGLPKGLGQGDILTMTVAYGGRVPPQTPEREAVTLLPPQTTAADIRRNSTFGQSDLPEVMPEPRYIYSHRSWWYPQPPVSEYAVARMRITVPAAYDVVGSGDPAVDSPRRSGTGAPGDPERKTFVFHASQPVRYLSWVASRMVPSSRATVDLPRTRTGATAETGGAATERPGTARPGVIYDGTEVAVVANPRQVGRGKNVLDTTTDALTLYSTLLDDVPYPTFTLALLDSALPGGHSPAYFAVMYEPLPTTPFSWRDDPVNFDSFPQFFLAHEIAHQFWGQAVGWKSYHEQWISEAFAQYFAALYAERSRGPGVFRDLMRQMRRSALSRADQGPVHLGYRLGHIEGDSRVFRSIVYNKGAMVLHMLRRLVGDEAFFRALRAFYWDSRFTKVGTDDLARVFERETGRPLGRFFEQWILQTGTPALRFSYVVTPPAQAPSTAATADGGTLPDVTSPYATLVFEQQGEPFEVPVTVTVTYASGEQEDVVVAVTGRRTERRIRLRGPVRTMNPNADFGALAYIDTVGRG